MSNRSDLAEDIPLFLAARRAVKAAFEADEVNQSPPMSDDPADFIPLYLAAERAVTAAFAADELSKITDPARAMRAAAHLAHDQEFEGHAIALRMRAELRLGQLMDAQAQAYERLAIEAIDSIEGAGYAAQNPAVLRQVMASMRKG